MGRFNFCTQRVLRLKERLGHGRGFTEYVHAWDLPPVRRGVEAVRALRSGEVDLIDRLKGDAAFAAVDIDALLDPRAFIGRCPQQVDAFLAECDEYAYAPGGASRRLDAPLRSRALRLADIMLGGGAR